MKIVYRNVSWIILFGIYSYLCLAEEDYNSLTIGTFYHDKKSQAKIALESAVYTTNIMQNKIRYKINQQFTQNIHSVNAAKLVCNLSSNTGLGLVLSPSSPIIQSICTNLEIPHFQLNWQNARKFSERTTVVNFFPHSDLFSEGIATIIRNLHWRSFVLLYETKEALIKLEKVLNLQNFIQNGKSSIIIRQLVPGLDHRPLLKSIRDMEENHIILDCDSGHIIKLLSQAKEVGLLAPYHHYFITSLDAHILDLSVLNSTANITTIRIINPEDDYITKTLHNWKQFAHFNYDLEDFNLKPFKIKTETALMNDAIQLFIESVNALHITGPIQPKLLKCDEDLEWEDGFRISSFVKLKTGYGMSGPLQFDVFGRRNNFTIYVVEGNGHQVIAQWKAEHSDKLTILRNQTNTFDSLVQNMQKGVLVVSSRLGPPYLMKRKLRYEGEILAGNDRYEGFSMDLIQEIADILGFKFEFRLAEDGNYGSYDPITKTWDGLIRDVLDHKADLAICDLTITHQRREVVDFSMPFMRLGVSILYKKANKENLNIFAFLAPFSFEIWVYTATLYLAVSIILYLVARMAPGDWENPHPCDPAPETLENIWNIKNCLWFTLGSIMTQGCDILPKGISSRMASSMWWFFSLIMTSSYTANLAAFLTMERLEPTINNAESLARQTKIKYGTVENGATQAFFRDSNYSAYHKMWTNMVQSKPGVFEKTNSDGVKRVQTTRHGLYAFLMESSQIEYEIETKCDLTQVGDWLDNKGYGIAMPLDYPYRGAINTAILKLQENFKLAELKKKWWKEMRDEPPCLSSSPIKKNSELALDNVGGVFLVLGIGVGIAFLIGAVEFLWRIRKVSVEEHLSFFSAFQLEIVFALNFWITKKRIKPIFIDGDTKSLGSLFMHFNTLPGKMHRSSRDEH